jgi:glycosyltransferase involved in cell wall biosynthesis
VTLEALSSGKPVITSDLPGMREVVVDGIDGFLAEPLNPNDIAKKIKVLLEDDELRRRFGRNGRLKVEERFHWPKITAQIEDVYKRVLAKRGE